VSPPLKNFKASALFAAIGQSQTAAAGMQLTKRFPAFIA